MANLFKSKLRIPSFAHEAFGEWQTPASLLAIACAALAAIALWAGALSELSLWRVLVAGLLILDIAAGAVANLTRGTNDFYKQRPRHRWGFIAIHLHLPIIGLALGEPMTAYLGVWAFTITSAIVVNLTLGRSYQTYLGGTLFCLGILVIPALAMSPVGTAISLLFLFKVVFSFAVDHYA